MPSLLDPWNLRGVRFRNRIGVSPMCMYSSEDGHATDWHLVHLGSRAVGGAGMVMAEATAVVPEGRITPRDAGLWSDSHIEPLARVTRFLREHGSVAGVQLAHAGRKASTPHPWSDQPRGSLGPERGGWTPVGASPIAFDARFVPPRELTIPELDQLVDAFISAGRRAIAAGHQFLEIHAAHGYLLHSFHSPLSNQRRDEYGGSHANRTRLTCRIARALRAAMPESMPLWVRLSCTDWAEGGWTLEESIELARVLKDLGVDVIDCSSGGTVSGVTVKTPQSPMFQVPFAEAIRRQAGIATAAVGEITTPAQADSIVREGRADMVLLARAMLRDPYWPVHAAAELGAPKALRWPPQYDAFVGPGA